MPTAALDHISLHYRLEGDGTDTVVLVNGLADELGTWDYQVPAFIEAGYRVLRFDNRGVGLSDKPTGPYKTADFVEGRRKWVGASRL
jgi:3-oxoadipate enol-lactonase